MCIKDKIKTQYKGYTIIRSRSHKIGFFIYRDSMFICAADTLDKCRSIIDDVIEVK